MDNALDLINWLPESQRRLWAAYAGDDGSEWLESVVGRMAVLLGDSGPLLVDADLMDDNGPAGFMLAVTATAIIRAEFTPAPGRGPRAIDARVEAVPRSAVTRVDSLVSGFGPARWRTRAQFEVHLDRELTGKSSLIVPAAEATSERADTVISVVSQLL